MNEYQYVSIIIILFVSLIGFVVTCLLLVEMLNKPIRVLYERECPASWQVVDKGGKYIVKCRQCGTVVAGGGTPRCLNTKNAATVRTNEEIEADATRTLTELNKVATVAETEHEEQIFHLGYHSGVKDTEKSK